jgi:hypothetical protein
LEFASLEAQRELEHPALSLEVLDQLPFEVPMPRTGALRIAPFPGLEIDRYDRLLTGVDGEREAPAIEAGVVEHAAQCRLFLT